MPTDIVFLGVKFSAESSVYTYVARRSWVKDLCLNDWLIVPVKDGSLKVVKFVSVQNTPPKNVPLKWIVQRVNPALIERAISQKPYEVQ
jgi:hypothetical protein